MRSPTFVIDFDSTLIQCESLEELAHIALANTPHRETVLEGLKAITAQGMAGSISFDESLQRRFKLFQAHRRHLDELTAYLVTQLSPSAKEHAAWFRENRERIYVISGGFREYIVPVVAQLGIAPTHVRANRFVYDEQENIVGFDSDTRPGKAGSKAGEIKDIHLQGKVIVVGDGYTDYEVKALGEADEFWAFTETIARPSVTTKADRVIHSFADLVAL